jgi:protoheme IX farnesyltransferase
MRSAPLIAAGQAAIPTGLSRPATTTVELALACLTLVKPKIVALVLFTSVVACVVAARGAPPWAPLGLLLVSGLLSAGGAAALNHYFDRDIDARMERTRWRPLPRGKIARPGLVLGVGAAMIGAGGLLATTLSSVTALCELAGALIYVVVYTCWLKRQTPLNIVVGGVAGSAAVLGGWAAASHDLGLTAWMLAGVVFFWTPAHFWSFAIARSDEYERAGVPMLPAVVGAQRTAGWVSIHVLATVALAVGVGLTAPAGLVYFGLSLGAGLGFLAQAMRLLRSPSPATGWCVFKWSGEYLGLVFLALLVDSLSAALWP